MLGLVIPVKMLDSSKMRLSSTLDADQRRRLTLAMLADVLRASEDIALRIVVTKDPDAEAVALANGCTICTDPSTGLNTALETASELAVTMGADSVLILQGDIPTVTPQDVNAICERAESVVVARSGDGGTNALLRRPPDAIGCAFGPHSAAAHVAQAKSLGRSVVMLDLDSIEHDIDDIESLAWLAEQRPQTQSARFARTIISRRGQEAGGL